MAIKKSELYSSLCAGCDALRGGMDEGAPHLQLRAEVVDSIRQTCAQPRRTSSRSSSSLTAVT